MPAEEISACVKVMRPDTNKLAICELLVASAWLPLWSSLALQEGVCACKVCVLCGLVSVVIPIDLNKPLVLVVESVAMEVGENEEASG